MDLRLWGTFNEPAGSPPGGTPSNPAAVVKPAVPTPPTAQGGTPTSNASAEVSAALTASKAFVAAVDSRLRANTTSLSGSGLVTAGPPMLNPLLGTAPLLAPNQPPGFNPLLMSNQIPSPNALPGADPAVGVNHPGGSAVLAVDPSAGANPAPGTNPVLGVSPRLGAMPAGGSASTYHGSGDVGASSPMGQKGVGAYLELLNAVAGNERHEKSTDLLTSGLRTASAALRSAYDTAMSRLPPNLAAKDWGISVANGKLVFMPPQDADLSAQDLAELRNAFTAANAESAAKQLADVITSIVQMRKAGADAGSLAWLRLDVDEANFGSTVDLRSYLTASSPGNLYRPNAGPLAADSQIPPMLGGLDLRQLVTARPNFLRADGSVSPEALNEFDGLVEIKPAAEEPLIATLHGQCSCRQVRFIVQDEFEYAFYCHCSRCRARTGSAFAAIAGIPIEKVEVIAGHEHLLLEGECSDGYGARCSRCFSFLFAAVRGRRYLHVSLGVLTDTPARVPDHHIYVGSKAPWYQITDTLPQYEELPSES
jgi:hypothetical protein